MGEGGGLKVSEIKQERKQHGLLAWQVNKFAVVKFYGLLTFARLPSAFPKEVNYLIISGKQMLSNGRMAPTALWNGSCFSIAALQ